MQIYNRTITHCFVVVSLCTRQYHHNVLIACMPKRTPKQNNKTPLLAAVKRRHFEIARMLLDAGAEHLDTKGVCESMMG